MASEKKGNHDKNGKLLIDKTRGCKWRWFPLLEHQLRYERRCAKGRIFLLMRKNAIKFTSFPLA